mmetsp:Transcript_6851/g.14559  ORF Transcript_6851/g.14559 Transcript_6851/m.14559 type:complete len:523 (-) Transcript_6851:183-1751(-)|eukprot:CAMPEP_0168191718 /NCGR_PEP_ID=MMETSP0139_2-20121125/17668_1 /TAXON_ID=44445 /ORGANISM="Pseudo-nitzschia australis, Strain 10249 10 AB" /LENGTH=522 /DNA_ID=CAMNT_0008114917 /DNA_START=333 /DNA_END=1901 /DNA_ORIENTATION=-
MRLLSFEMVGFLFLATPSFAFLSTSTLLFLNRSELQPIPTTRAVRMHSSSLSSWSKVAEFDIDSGSFRLTDATDFAASVFTPIAASQEQNRSSSGIEYDLTSPREWLEFCEAHQHRQEDSQQQDRNQTNLEEQEPCGGAYTVLRCDFLLDQKTWRIWGKDFHWNRLRESYRSLLQQQALTVGRDESNEKWEQSALDSSIEVMDLLLTEAETSILSKNKDKTNSPSEKSGNLVVIVMLTLLWDPEPNDRVGIRVRGHVFSAMKASQLLEHDNENDNIVMDNPNAPVQAVIGYLPPAVEERVANYYDKSHREIMSLPNRIQHIPQAKLSSWCRRRRPLEEMFKSNNAGDVILTKQCEHNHENDGKVQEPSKWRESSIELLEGLTSNLFVVYPENVLRTAPSSHVLAGYARDLIVECANECGYRVEFGPITMADSSKWKEVFLTSSIRLIIPVNRILLPIAAAINKDDNGNNDDNELFQLDTIWEMPLVEELANNGCSPLLASHALYNQLMKNARDVSLHTTALT